MQELFKDVLFDCWDQKLGSQLQLTGSLFSSWRQLVPIPGILLNAILLLISHSIDCIKQHHWLKGVCHSASNAIVGVEIFDFWKWVGFFKNWESGISQKIQASGSLQVLSGSIPCHLKRFLQLQLFHFLSILEFWLGRTHRRGFLA